MEAMGSGASGPPRHILVVEDEPGLREELTLYLSRAGWRTEGVGDALAAQQCLHRDRGFTVLLTDIRLPGMNGLALAKKACAGRNEFEAMEVVLLTGHGTMDDAVEALRLGAFDFIRKPLALSALRVILERAHECAAQRRAAEGVRRGQVRRLREEQALMRAELCKRSDAMDFRGNIPRELASIFSHELRTPLVALSPALESLRSDTDLPAGEVMRHLEVVHATGSRLRQIADDFGELISPPDTKSLRFGPVAPAAILRQLHARGTVSAARGRHVLHVVCTAGGTFDTDSTCLVHALLRLVANATVWCPAGSEIELSASDGPSFVAFAVSDNGPGMTSDAIAKAQEPFHQAEAFLTPPADGLGLGLPLAGRMARRLGGDLRIEAAGHSGTRACIVLPRRHALDPISTRLA